MRFIIILFIAVVVIAYQVSAQARENSRNTQSTRSTTRRNGNPGATTNNQNGGRNSPRSTSASRKPENKQTRADRRSTTISRSNGAQPQNRANTTEKNNGESNRKHTASQLSSTKKQYHTCFCENLKGKNDIVLRSLEGNWFVRSQQSAHSFYPFTGDCARGQITYVNDKNLKFTVDSSFRGNKILTKDSKLTYLGKGVFSWSIDKMSIDKNEVPIKSVLKLSVIDVDYKDYLLFYICGNINIGGEPSGTPAAGGAENEKLPPPSSFVILSRSQDKKYDMNTFNKTISEMYDCYQNILTETKQDAKACRRSA